MKILYSVLLILASSAVMAGGTTIEDFTFDSIDIQSESNFVLPESNPNSDEPSDEFLRGLKAGMERGRSEGISECNQGVRF